jgi:GNAT superfamily N-acetyltransferase
VTAQLADLAYRPAVAADLSLVYGTWLASFRLSHAAGLVPMATYGAVYTDAIDRLLKRRGTELVVAYHPGAELGDADLYGFACAELGAVPLVHYVYTIETFRRRGLARELLEHAGIDLAARWEYSYRTPVVAKLAGKLGQATWAPLRARDEERPHGQGPDRTRDPGNRRGGADRRAGEGREGPGRRRGAAG